MFGDRGIGSNHRVEAPTALRGERTGVRRLVLAFGLA
jgi:hypothetical protein